MKVRYRKGVATHSGPESCGAGREADVEALTGETAGQPLSREIGKSGAPTPLSYAEGKTEGGAYREPSEGSTRSKTLSMRGNPSYGNWEISSAPEIGRWPKGALGKADGRNPEEQTDEKSDACIVPRNDPNNGGGSKPPSAEDQEGRRAAKRNVVDFPAPRTQSRTSASTEMDSVREAAGRDKNLRFTALMHHITPELLTESFMDLKRSAAAGVDGVTWRDYENGLDDRIALLWDAVQSGRYRAQPSRRVYIPKADGSQRPLGIAALEDKIVQQAVVTVLTAIYETDFLRIPMKPAAIATAFASVSISATAAVIDLISPTALLVAPWIAAIWAAMSSVAVAVCPASVLTSKATTAKPLPASPARAASIVAFKASKLVC